MIEFILSSPDQCRTSLRSNRALKLFFAGDEGPIFALEDLDRLCEILARPLGEVESLRS